MTVEEWKKQIIKDCKSVGTYKTEFNITYDLLADTLYRLEIAKEEYAESNEMIIEHTNKGGATNREQNPLLRLISTLKDEANKMLCYCGLNATSLKKINESAVKSTGKVSALADALAKFG